MEKSSIGKYRWVIVTLLLFSTTINYMDRQVIGYVKEFFCMPVAKGGFGWTDTDYSDVTSAFTAFYATVTILAGYIIDKIGTKLGLALSLIIWSIFGILNAFVGGSVAVHAFVRSLFGIGEAGNFPASIKTVAEWFPKKERALATGIFNSGANLGAMVTSLFVPWCLVYFGYQQGWKLAYIITGVVGFIWLFFWFAIYTTPAKSKKLGQEEFDFIHSDDVAVHAAASEDVAVKEVNTSVPWKKLFGYRQTWAFFTGKFVTDGVWWFLLFWLPDYLKKQFGFTGHSVMLPTFIVYGIAIIGSVFGGSIPLFFINRGMEVYKARMTAMLIIALFPLVLISTQYFGDKAIFGDSAATLAIAVICIGAAAHQAWSANLFSTVSDMFPKKAIGSVVGIGGMAGGIGGVLIQQMAGRLNTHYAATPQTAYLIMFVFCAVAYIIPWTIMKILVPRFRPITDL
ncbi:MFS transporter [Mucilaginibacter robiniae]|uniref:MFS transporter n=1 Tax=Mucilaginibacter robiniae TaxID=2728022 RepID=A0A7L5DY02_9SPHI|nr:MFS transporter [Mucilaginibacter robiniae]QJD94909.1 MFS transporter [Mucilaginibacter robiniae]